MRALSAFFAVIILMVVGVLFLTAMIYLGSKTHQRASMKQRDSLSFTINVKPIIVKRCMPCHTGQIPNLPNFTLYEVAFKKRATLKERVWEKKNMPPGGGTITKEERKTIKTWVDQGGLE